MKTVMRYHHTSLRLAKIKKTVSSVGDNVDELKSHSLLVEIWNDTPKLFDSFSKRKHTPTIWSSHSTPRCWLKANIHHTKTYTQMFMNLYWKSQGWKQPKCPSTGEWVNTLQYIHTTEYYSVVKGNTLSISGIPCMNLNIIMPNEVVKWSGCCLIPFLWN